MVTREYIHMLATNNEDDIFMNHSRISIDYMLENLSTTSRIVPISQKTMQKE